MGLEIGAEPEKEVIKVEKGKFGESRLGWHNVAGGAYHCGVVKGFKYLFHKVWWGIHICVEEH